MSASADLSRPIWDPSDGNAGKGGFHEVWFLKLNDPDGQRAFWLRFALLVSQNGFRRVAETWAIHFQRTESGEVVKTALKHTQDIGRFSADPSGTLKIGDSYFSPQATRGSVSAKGKVIRWDLEATPDSNRTAINHIPDFFQRMGLSRSTAVTLGQKILFNGTTEIAGQIHRWQDCPGMLEHQSGTGLGHSWVWAHANSFVNERGVKADFVFEGISTKSRLFGSIATPRLSSAYFEYKGTPYHFNSVWDSFRLRSKTTVTDWNFQADRGDLSFRGLARAEHKDFAGLTYEDTDGSLAYCANAELADFQVHVYRRGKLEDAFFARGTAGFELVDRTKNPYVSLLV